MTRKKIVYVLRGVGVGGIEMHSCRQLALLSSEDWERHLVTLTPVQDRDRALIPEGVTLHPFHFSGIWDFAQLFLLARRMRIIRPDIVVSSVFDANMITRIIKLVCAYRLINREHSITVDKPHWQRRLDRLLSPLADVIVAVSHAVADFESEQSGLARERFVVIHNGVDLGAVEDAKQCDRSTMRRELGIRESEKIIVSVGRLKEQKNHALLLDAFALFAKNVSGYTLLLVGDGGERGKLEDRARGLGIFDRVVFAGRKENALPYYTLADFSALTSPYEGFGTVCVESLAFGKPVVATRSRGVEEILEDGITGLLTDHNVEALAQAFDRMARRSSDERERMEHACVTAAAKFSLERNVAAYERLFIPSAKPLVLFALPGVTLGGIERHLARQLQHFDNKYRYAILLPFAKNSDTLRSIFPESVPVYALGFTRLLSIATWWRLYRFLRFHQPRIVVSSVYTTNALILIMSYFCRFRFIAREHNVFPRKSWRFRVSDALVARRADAYIGNSNGVADDMARNALIARERIAVIPNGIDLEEMGRVQRSVQRDVIRHAWGANNNTRVILSVGRLRVQKRHELLLRAVASMSDKDRYVVVIVGDGPERATLERVANDLHIQHMVKFLGARDALPVYPAADVFVLTSEREGFPNVVLEALASGIPVVSTRMPGVVDVITEGVTGALVSSDSEAVARGIRMVSELRSQKGEEVAEHCRQSVQSYDIHKNTSAYTALFSRLLS